MRSSSASSRRTVDVAPFLETTHLAERDRALVGVTDAFERLVLDTETNERREVAVHAPGR